MKTLGVEIQKLLYFGILHNLVNQYFSCTKQYLLSFCLFFVNSKRYIMIWIMNEPHYCKEKVVPNLVLYLCSFSWINIIWKKFLEEEKYSSNFLEICHKLCYRTIYPTIETHKRKREKCIFIYSFYFFIFSGFTWSSPNIKSRPEVISHWRHDPTKSRSEA